MIRLSRLLLAAAMLVCSAVPMMAQTPSASAKKATQPRPYFIGGLAFEWRDVGITRERSWQPAPTLGGGVWLNRFVGIDAAIEIGPSESFDYTTSYSAPIQHHTGTHRDSMILGSIRARLDCRAAVCMNFVGGGGVGVHHTSSIIRDTCGEIGIPKPCVLVNKLDWSTSEAAANVSFGFDVPIGRPSSRVSIMPSLRTSLIVPFAPAHLHGSHEPGLTDGWFASAGVLVSIR